MKLANVLCTLLWLMIAPSDGLDDQTSLFDKDPIAIVSVIHVKNHPPLKYDEIYSDNLRRGKVEVGDISYFSGEDITNGIVVLPRDSSLYNSNEDSIWDRSLYGFTNYPLIKDIMSQVTSTYIIGPSKLFILIGKSNLSPSSRDPERGRTLSIQLKDKTSINLEISYDTSNIDPKKDIPRSVSYENDGFGFSIEFTIWPNYDQFTRVLDEESLNNLIEFSDPLTYPIGMSDFLKKQELLISARISFEAKTKHKDGSESLERVLLDLSSLLMRVNELGGSGDMIVDMNSRFQYLFDPSIEDGCVVIDLDRVKVDIYEYFFGAKEFAFMGEGTVRGVRVGMFEAKTNILPVWLARYIPVDKERETIYIGRNNTLGLGSTSYWIIVHTRNYQDKSLVLSEIISIRVYEITSNHMSYLLFISDIYNNNNYIDEEDELRSGNIFSVPECYSNRDQSYDYIDIELYLKYTGKKSQKLIESGSERNEALVDGLSYYLQVPMSAILDLRSKIYPTHVDNQARFGVSIRFGLKTPKVRSVKYLNMGRTRGTRDSYWPAESVGECLIKFDTINRKNNEILYYSHHDKLCIIDNADSGVSNNSVESSIADGFIANKFEVGRLHNRYERSLTTIKQRLSYSRYGSNSFSTFIGEDKFDYKIEDSKILIQNKSKNNDITFVGVSIKLEADKSQSINLNNLESCETACFEDFNCRSFSFCQSEPSCIHSSMSLEAARGHPMISEQISKIMIKNRGSIITLNLTQGSLTLIRDHSCSLHNKRHIDMFSFSLPITVGPDHLSLIQVDSIEDCATKCFNRTLFAAKGLQLIDNEIMKSSTTNQGDVSIDPKPTLDLLKDIEIKRQYLFENLCDNFYYVDRSISSSSVDSIIQYMKSESIVDENLNAICVSDTRLKAASGSQSTRLHGLVKFDQYKMNFEFLYRKVYDISMTSSLNDAEMRIFRLASQGNKLTDNELESARKIVIDKRNYHYEKQLSKGTCATFCFKQISDVWPSCKSFDTFQKMDGDIQEDYCIFNSASMDSPDAINLTNIGSSSGPIQRVHWEPRFGIAKLESDAIAELEIERESIWSVLVGYYKNQTSHGWLIFLLILVGSVCGLLAGITLVRPVARYFRLKDGKETSDLSTVMVLTPPLED